MKKIQINIDWNVVFWIGILMIFFWLIAKALGLIHTPLIVQIIPYVGGLVALFGLFRNAGKYIQKLDTVILDVNDIKLNMKDMKHDVHSLDKKFAVLEADFRGFDRRLAALETRI